MNHSVLKIIEGKFLWASSQVSILIEVALYYTFYWSYDSIASDVEFSFVYKKRIMDVFLDNNCSTFARVVFYELSNLRQVFPDFNTLPSVSVLTRLNNPNILWLFLHALEALLESLKFRVLSTFNMESQWKGEGHIFSYSFIVILHVDKESFLIT